MAISPVTFNTATSAWDAGGTAPTTNPVAVTGGGAKLYDYTVTGAAKASIDTAVDGTTVANFAGYSVLEWFLYARTDEAAVVSVVQFNLNNDTSAIYDAQQFRAVNTTVSGGPSLTDTSWLIGLTGDNCAAGVFSNVQCWIPNYLGTVGNKAGTLQAGIPDSTAANTRVLTYQLGYRSSTAVSRLKVAAPGASKLKIGSRLLVYGR